MTLESRLRTGVSTGNSHVAFAFSDSICLFPSCLDQRPQLLARITCISDRERVYQASN
jgi:hypothetical protein